MLRQLWPILTLAFATPAFADDTDAEWTLEAPDQVPMGGQFGMRLHGPPNELALLFVSAGEGPVETVYGTLCVDLPAIANLVLPLDSQGEFSMCPSIGCDPNFIGFTVYTQFITCDPTRGRSNGRATEFVDAICDGHFCSQTQGGWGTECEGDNPGCRRDAYFDDVFPNGLILGDQDGDDDDSERALIFTSSSAVESFLPYGGRSGTQDRDDIDPSYSSAGVFAGQLAAAKLNVAFDDYGAFADDRSRADIHLGDLVFVACVDRDLRGLTVREVLEISDLVFSGYYGSCHGRCRDDDIVDIDGDGDDDVSIEDLVEALEAINENFTDCDRNEGCLDIQ